MSTPLDLFPILAFIIKGGERAGREGGRGRGGKEGGGGRRRRASWEGRRKGVGGKEGVTKDGWRRRVRGARLCV